MSIPNWLPRYQADLTQQDHDLLQFVIDNNISGVKYLGNCLFLKSIIKKESNKATLSIFLVNQTFRFSEIVDICNQEIKQMLPNSFFYLSINKFFAVPEPQQSVSDDYDDAIYEYIKNKISCPIIKYLSGKDDYGQKFNWGHPLTRFYFSNANNI